MTPPVPEEDDILVAELAFGLLDPDESVSARARIAPNPLLAVRLATWERLATALLDHAEHPAPPSLWSRIDVALPANDTSPAAADPAILVARWRAASIALALTAAILGALALRSPAPAPMVVQSPAPAPSVVPSVVEVAPLVAVLRAARGGAALSVGFDPGDGRLTLAADALAAGRGSAQLWVIPADGTPRSLGLIDAENPSWRRAPESARLIVPGVTLAVSLEPAGGSPTGLPTSAPVLTGTVAAAADETATKAPARGA